LHRGVWDVGEGAGSRSARTLSHCNNFLKDCKMSIDTTFNFYSDAKGRDPDRYSPTLKKHHKALWSKPLPNGKNFEISDNTRGAYLHHKSELGEFYLGSDAITHSYKHHIRMQPLLQQITSEVDDLFDTGSTIGGYIVFPGNQIDGKFTINQARGVHGRINDRFDLTLECIRLYYLGQTSPLFDTLLRYKGFFDLFGSFVGYIQFFLLDDLIDERNDVKFYLPFDGFKTRPTIADTNEYLLYKAGVMKFIRSRNSRIEEYAKERMTK